MSPMLPMPTVCIAEARAQKASRLINPSRLRSTLAAPSTVSARQDIATVNFDLTAHRPARARSRQRCIDNTLPVGAAGLVQKLAHAPREMGSLVNWVPPWYGHSVF